MSHETATPVSPRRRRWWMVAALLALPLFVVLVALWALNTGSGRDVVLAQAARFLPPDALTWRVAEGHLVGGLVLHDVHYLADGIEVRLARVEVDVAGMALLGGDVHVRRLSVVEGSMQLPSSDSDAGWPERIELPEVLPELALPLNLRVEALEARNVTLHQGDTTLLVVQRLETGVALESGELRLQRLALDSDRLGLALDARIDTRRHWDSDVTAEARWAIDAGEPLPLSLRLRGDLDDLRLNVEAEAGALATAELNVRGGLPNPQWSLALEAPQVAPDRFGIAGEPLSVALQGEGDLEQMRISGRLRQGTLDVVLAPSLLTYRDTTLALAPLALELLGGRVELSGDVDLSHSDPHLVLAMTWRDIVMPAAVGDSVVRTQGQARADGSIDSYALTLEGVFTRGQDRASVALEGLGSTRDLMLQTLEARLPGGSLEASGHLAWQPAVELALDARLERFDPAYFMPDFPGAIDARLTLRAGFGDAGPHGELALDDLSGQLRGHVLGGSARATADRDGHGQGAATLRLGESRVRAQGQWGDRFDVEAILESLSLSDLLPQARGVATGQILLRGPRNAPTLSVQLDGKAIQLEEATIDLLRLRAELQEWDRGTFSLEAGAAVLAGQRVDTLSLSAEGSRAEHRVSLTALGPSGAVGLDFSGALDTRGTRWQGILQDLHLEPAERTAWRLREAAGLSYMTDGRALSLSRACLDAAPARLCAEIRARGASSEGDVELDGLSLSELDPLLATALDHPVALSGQLSAVARFTRSANGDLEGEADLVIPQATMKIDAQSERALVDLSDVRLNAVFDPAQARLRLEAVPARGGHVFANLVTEAPMQDDGALSGEVGLSLPDLAALELFTDQVVDPQGRIEGRLTFGGSRAAPMLDGTLELQDFSAELPALGIAPREGHVVLSSDSARQARLSGALLLGDGRLMIDGRFDLASAGGTSGSLSLTGENLTVMQTPEAQVRASPDLRIELGQSRVKVRGNVVVPFARIDLERLESMTAPSSDVVIVDAPASSSGPAIDADVSVTLGDRVRMNGFGLKGTLAGQLRVIDRPGRATTARGAIEVGGAYKAYGQDLTITRGQVAWASTPIDTPRLDIRAQRRIDTVTVGVQVRGTALVPELTLWSDPAMEQAEQLSYLVLGRPLRSASQADGAQLTQAAAAMGGNLLAKNLGARLGVDEVEVADNRALGGAALTVGMHLSPRLHVSYGVALFGSGQVVTFKYLLSRVWNIQIDSGTENRAALNYRLER
ncbi:translocation/assembly module TamB domain-containing protein [Xanthomonadaceae bacterium XH05]|nr:translocation/assembly module TamB domain-containing protein [Xanthomonadaceae bacterium XH05]